jgi:hypothetical protein
MVMGVYLFEVVPAVHGVALICEGHVPDSVRPTTY